MAIISKRKTNGKKYAPMSEMNVTPMIDVMLVLLVIFMVTAPLLTVGVKVELPKVKANNIISNQIPIVVSVTCQGKILVGDVEVDLDTLPEKLRAIAMESDEKLGIEETKIFVKADKNISYGCVAEVMCKISSAGMKKVILVTELPK